MSTVLMMLGALSVLVIPLAVGGARHPGRALRLAVYGVILSNLVLVFLLRVVLPRLDS